MSPIFKSRRYRVAGALCIALTIFVTIGLLPEVAHGATKTAFSTSELSQQNDSAQTAEENDSPRACIDPLMASHIAATLVSLLPLPGFADAADAAAYVLNIALKYCPPDLTPPPDIVVEEPNRGCVHRLQLPTPLGFADLVALDKTIIEEMLADLELNLSPSERLELESELDSEYGRFDNLAYGTYSNVYGLSLPIKLMAYTVPDRGDVGAPKLFHYNSDALLELTVPGRRISPTEVEVRVGNHQLQWKADTLISEFDFVPFFLASSAMRYYKAAQAKAQKRFAIDGSKAALKKQIELVLKEGNRYFAKQVAKEIAKNALKKGALAGGKIVYKSGPYFTPGDFSGASTLVLQSLRVIDGESPVISGVAPVIVEAFDPGGIASGRKIGELAAAIQVTDDCDPEPSLSHTTARFWPLLIDANGDPLPSAEIIWRASDNGAASAAGGVNTTEVVQQVTVVDTLPPILVEPPAVMKYAAADESIEIPLGSPQVFDVADLRPSIEYDAPNTAAGSQWPLFGRGVHYVTWTATDQSGNISEPKQQLVNVKAPGTNNTPTAFPQMGADTVQAVADTPVRIIVRGEDPDVDPLGMRDPIWFRVARTPDHGFFIAPLYPYFIDDYRMTARYSPSIAQKEGEEFAWQVAQDTSAMHHYIKDLCAEDINRTDLPKDFISFNGSQKYIAVDDDGFTYIYDSAYRKCTPGGSTVAPYTTPRISVWDQEGLYVGEQERTSGGRPLKDIKFNIGRRTILTVASDGSSTGNSVVNISTIQPQIGDEPIVDVRSYGLWNSVNTIYIEQEDVNRTPEYKNAGAAVFDDTNGVLYVIGDRNQNLKGMSAFMPAPCNSSGKEGPEDCLEYIGSQIYSHSIVQSTKWGEFSGLDVDAMRLVQLGDITLDSLGNVYVLAKATSSHRFDRIYKFAPAVKHADGGITLGEYIGWMEKCDSGPNCNYIEQRSIGFACTDDTCSVEGDTSFGSRPGQFESVAAIAMDPNDVLYVADSGNDRVQRFSQEGLFAGEARSQSACPGCSGFVLGDFGSPGNIAVNSNNFYILDISTELVHVFETSVIHSIDDSSAWLEYQSDTNWVGPDSFTFRATDGFQNADGDLIESDPATVAISVARNFRPPIAEDGWATTSEDSAVPLTLQGYDLDRELDTLTYAVVFAPQYGELSGSPPTVTYKPGEDFSGEDVFEFSVSDGKFTSEAAIFTIEVTAVNDTPNVVPEANALQAGLGHAVTLNVSVFDPDEDDVLAAVVDWGDGTKESSGELDSTGGVQGPSLTPLVSGRAELVAYHTYDSAGAFTIAVEVMDVAGAKGTAQVQVTVAAMADLALQRKAQPFAPASQSQLSYELIVRNQRSAQGDGVAASSVRVSEVVTGSATFAAAIASSGDCQVDGKSFTCTLGTLNPDQEAKVTVQLHMSGASAGAVVALDAVAASETSDPIVENNRDRFDVAVVPEGDFYVDSLRDGADASPGDGLCATAEGECTVRVAIMEANALAGAQTIVFPNGVFVLEDGAETAAGGAEDSASGDLDIDGDVTLLGIGAEETVLHGNALDRVLEIHSGVVRMENLAISGGNAGASAEGGGIYNNGGEVLLLRVTVDGNSAVNGGAIMNATGQMRIVESSIVQNTAQGSGGGIMNQATLTLENVTISGNQASGGGGFAGVGGDARLLYVTLVGNSASNAGGGINSTGNSVRIENTLLAGNDAPIGPDCAPELVSGGHNLIGTLKDCGLSGSTSGNVTGQTPKIDGLGLNSA